jgi:hypothetical protein
VLQDNGDLPRVLSGLADDELAVLSRDESDDILPCLPRSGVSEPAELDLSTTVGMTELGQLLSTFGETQDSLTVVPVSLDDG